MPALAITVFAAAIGTAVALLAHLTGPLGPVFPGCVGSLRGCCINRYRFSADGRVAATTLIPPTSQNQAAIEADLARAVSENLSLDDATLTTLCEKVIRSYDPCISCSAHFLTLTVERR